MSSFLITFKPATENPEQGWPVEALLNLKHRLESGGVAREKWRFHNRKDIKIGERAFLLLQGKRGPAIIGYGHIVGAGERERGKRVVPIEFERLVDPRTHCFATPDELREIEGSQKFWKIPSSGVALSDEVAEKLESTVVGRSARPLLDSSVNPDWVKDELIVALNVYLQFRPNLPGKESKEIADLSRVLNRLGEKLFPPESRSSTFRNENGVYMKLMNFRRFDPEYTSDGRTGLSRGSKIEERVWTEFAVDPHRCRQVAEAIIANADNPEVGAIWFDAEAEDDLEEAEEGRLLTGMHRRRERNRKLVESKRKQALKLDGKLICEVCRFDFATQYGLRGDGFIECHHTKPVATLAPRSKTHLDDLALVCANCHRMIHRRKPWLSIAELKARIHT